MFEVIRHEGDKWILYSADGSKKLGEFDTKEAAEERERQIQFFKHQASLRPMSATLVEKHSAAWHRCWDSVKRNYSDRSAAAICTWSLGRAGGDDVYESVRLAEAPVILTLDDAMTIDEVLAAEMELRGLEAISIDPDTWEIQEIEDGHAAGRKEAATMPDKLIALASLLEHSTLVELIEQYAAWLSEQAPGGPEMCVCPECGHEQEKVRGIPCRSVTCPECGAMLIAKIEAIDVQEAARNESLHKAVQEIGRRHTKREYEIIEEMIRLLAELHGEIDDMELVLQRAEEADRYVRLREAANVADYLEANIHREFTLRADGLLEKGIINRDERIVLSGFIGQALGLFSELVNGDLGDLRTRSYPANEWGEPMPAMSGDEEEAAPVSESARDLVELVERAVASPTLSDAGNLSGVVLVEGRSANRNVYTRQALETGPAVFAGRPIYADHPSRSEEADRPERSIRDLVGRLPSDPADLWVGTVESGPHAGKLALHYRNGKLSETAGWLATLIREGIAGEQSINAFGVGREDPETGDFVVEAFERAISLDFVTSAAAGGQATLVESAPGASQENTEDTPGSESWIESLTVERVAEARPDIVDIIAQRERRKAYGEKSQLVELQEANKVMSDKLKKAKEAARKAIREKRRTQADQIVEAGLVGLPESVRPQVRRLIEGYAKRFVEQVEVPTIDLPEDVQALPEEAASQWLGAYMESLSAGDGEEAAAHAAWTAVLASWEKDEESGEWRRKSEPEEPEELLGLTAPEEPMTIEALRRSVAGTVEAFRKALAEAAGPGVSGVTAPNPQASQEAEEEARIERYRRAGLSEAEAKIAARGRV